jgi:hypothetical protein
MEAAVSWEMSISVFQGFKKSLSSENTNATSKSGNWKALTQNMIPKIIKTYVSLF